MENHERFCIDCLSARVIIDTNVPLRQFFLKNKDRIEFPALVILDAEKAFENEKHIMTYRNSQKKAIACSEKEISVSYPYEELTDKNIVYLSKYLIEKQLGEMGMVTCHSACVSKNGKAILLLGDAGAGKTSTALNLCLKNGYSLISNDKTVIGIKDGSLYAFDGTKYLNLRYKSIKENLPQFISLFESEDIEAWTEKIKVQAHEIGIEESYEPTEITDILFLHVDNREERLVVGHGDSHRNNFILYNNLTENIRASSSTFVDKKGHPVGYIPSYDSESTYWNRVKIIQKINQNPRYRYVSGKLHDVLEYINSTRDNIVDVKEADEFEK